jgi:hypothetical protein
MYGRPPPPCTGWCTGATFAGDFEAQKAKNHPKVVVRGAAWLCGVSQSSRNPYIPFPLVVM